MSILSDYAYNDFGNKFKGSWYNYYIFVVGGIFVLLNYIILLEFCKNLVILLKRRQENK